MEAFGDIRASLEDAMQPLTEISNLEDDDKSNNDDWESDSFIFCTCFEYRCICEEPLLEEDDDDPLIRKFYEDTLWHWKNKDSTDQKLHAKDKARRYTYKYPDNEIKVAQTIMKIIPRNILKELDKVIAIGSESMIFRGIGMDEWKIGYGKFAKSKMCPVPVLVKIWHKPNKELLNFRKIFFENDPEFLAKLNIQNSGFKNLWAAKEFANYERIRESKGVKIPKILYHTKNILIMRFGSVTSDNLQDWWKDQSGDTVQYLEDPLPTLEEDINRISNNQESLQESFDMVLKMMVELYNKAGLVHGALTAADILTDGCLIDVAQAMDKNLPGAFDFLYKDCISIFEFFKSSGLNQSMDTNMDPERMFRNITGSDYEHPIETRNIQLDLDMETRIIERKSERSRLNRINHLATRQLNSNEAA